MPTWLLAVILKPFILLIVFVGIVWPIKMLFWKFLPDGPMKKLLFTRISNGDGNGSGK